MMAPAVAVELKRVLDWYSRIKIGYTAPCFSSVMTFSAPGQTGSAFEAEAPLIPPESRHTGEHKLAVGV